MTVFFILSLFIFTTIFISNINNDITNNFYQRNNINLVITGDINDISDGKITNQASYEETLNLLSQLNTTLLESDYIQEGNIEYYLQSDNLISCTKLDDPNSFDCGFCDLWDANKDNWMRFFSRDYINNEHYYNVLAYFNEGYWRFTNGFNPTIVGVSDGISDMRLTYSKLTEGRMLEDDDHLKVIVPKNFAFVSHDGIKQANIGDKFPITIKNNDQEITTYFEIVGKHDGNLGIEREAKSAFRTHNESLYNFIYVSNNDLLSLANQISSIDNRYGSKLGIRQLVYTLDTNANLDDLITIISNYTDKLNEINPDIYYKYTYYSTNDYFANAFSAINNNNLIITTLKYISIFISYFIMLMIIMFDINNNKKEIGIKYALGMSKLQILKEHIMQYLTLSIIPLICAIFTSYILCQKYQTKMLELFRINELNASSKIFIFNTQTINEFTSTLTITDVLMVIAIWFIIMSLVIIIIFIKINKLNIKRLLLEEDN